MRAHPVFFGFVLTFVAVGMIAPPPALGTTVGDVVPGMVLMRFTTSSNPPLGEIQ